MGEGREGSSGEERRGEWCISLNRGRRLTTQMYRGMRARVPSLERCEPPSDGDGSSRANNLTTLGGGRRRRRREWRRRGRKKRREQITPDFYRSRIHSLL